MSRLHSKLAVSAIFRKFSILRNFAFYNLCQNLGFQPLQQDWATLAAVYYTMVSLLRQSFSENLDLGLSSEKLVICEISHFTNFSRSLVYFPWIKSVTTSQLLILLNGINMTLAFLKKGSIKSLLKKVVSCEVSHFTTFAKYFFH